jgi:LPS sulfotransferase NodH
MRPEPLAREFSPEQYRTWIWHPSLPKRPTRPQTSYFICSAPRAGSWLLCGLLASTGVAGWPHEWFEAGFKQACWQEWNVRNFRGFIARVRDAGTTPNGIFGAKLNWHYMETLARDLHRLGGGSPRLPAALRSRLGDPCPFPGPQAGPSLISRHFPDPRYIWLRRQDSVAQAISFARAWQTGRWHGWSIPSSQTVPEYDRALIDMLIDTIADHEAGWRGWFDANRIEPLELRYEDLVADPEGVTRTLMRDLDIDSDGVRIAPLTGKMSDAVNDEWLQRYLASPPRARPAAQP